MNSKKGFTLLEILLVVGIISILAGIVIIAINPGKQLATVRNTERKANLGEINKAMVQYYIDNNRYPTSTPTTLTEICDTGSRSYPSSLPCTGMFDLSALVPTYIAAIPTDPQGASTTLTFLDKLIPIAEAHTGGSGYQVMQDSTGKVVLNAPMAELGTQIAIGSTTGSGVVVVSMPSGLVTHWKMNDNTVGSYTVTDNVGGNNGTSYTNTTATMSVAGFSANTTPVTGHGALSFNGSNDFINTTGAAPISGDRTFTFWANPQSKARSIIISDFSSSLTAKLFLTMAISDTSGHIGFYDGTAWRDFGVTATWNSWHHYAFVFSGSTAKLYIDGVPAGSTLTYATQSTASNDKFVIGDYSTTGSGNSSYQGVLDDLRIYSRALSVGEIAQIVVGTEAE